MNSILRKMAAMSLCSTAMLMLAGCDTVERLKEIGRPPVLSEIKNPKAQPGYKPVSLPMPVQEPVVHKANSLWRSGARSFFKDQRASRIGDILTIIVDISDKAEFGNTSERSRDNSENMGLDSLAGFEQSLAKILPGSPNMSELIKATSESKSVGGGKINRSEKVNTRMAAMVTQALPNGNLVIEGRQEIRVNSERRDIVVAGIVRPEDISAENTVPISKIAEARVSYGGRGQISEVQKPRYGQQLMDVFLPF